MAFLQLVLLSQADINYLVTIFYNRNIHFNKE